MSLQTAVAAAFKHHGRDRLTDTDIVSALALDRGWFTPEEVRTLIDRAVDSGELTEVDGAFAPTFDIGSVTIPAGYEPPPDLLAETPPFEQILVHLEEAGHERRASVAAINELQAEMGVTSDAAALVYAHSQAIDVTAEARSIRRALESSGDA